MSDDNFIHVHNFDPSSERCTYCDRTRQDIEADPDLKPKIGQMVTLKLGEHVTIMGPSSDVWWIKDVLFRERSK